MNIRLHQSVLSTAFVLLVGHLIAPAESRAAEIDYQNLTIGPSGALIGGLGDIFNIRGNLTNNSTQNTVWDTHLSQIGFNASGTHQLTWTGTEQGRGNAGFINNFAVGNFVLPAGASLTTLGGGSLYTRVLSLGGGVPQISSISGALNIHYNPGSPQNVYLNFQTYSLPNGFTISPAAAPADVNAAWNGTAGNWTDGTKWSGSNAPLNPSTSVTLYDATINSGTVTLDQNIGYIQKLTLGSAGTLSGAAAVTPWDMFTWGTVANNNASTISGGATVNANGNIAILGDSGRNLNNATINNHAGYIATWTAGNSDINFSNGAAFNNFGSFIVQNNRSLGHNGGTGVFNNYGTFTKNTGSGTTNIGSPSFVFNNQGAINVQTGTLESDGPLQGPTTGSISVSSGASMVIADGAIVFGGGISSAGPLNIGDASGATNSASLQLLADNQINNTSVLTIKSDGLLNLNGVAASVGALVINSGNVATGSGTLIPSSLSMAGGTINGTGSGKLQLTSGMTAVSDVGSNPAIISAPIDLNSATRTFTANPGPAVTDLMVSGNVSNGGLTKTGLGAMTLSGNNGYAGGTTLSQGTLNINNPNAIGVGTFTVNGVSTINNTSGAPLTLATNNPLIWATPSFAFTGSQSLNFGTGTVTLNSNPIVTVLANTLTVGVIGNGTGNSLTKVGTGTLQLFGGAAYTGTTADNAGTLTINGGSFASSTSTVAAAATMNFINGANAGSGTFANIGSTTSTPTGGLIQFVDNGTTAGSGVFTNNGGTATGNGAQIVFNSGSSGGNATITNIGANGFTATASKLLFNDGSTAGNAIIATHGGIVVNNNGAITPGAVTLFSGNATAGSATILTDSNGGSFYTLPGFTEFKDTSNSGTANITINSQINAPTFNKWINSASAASATITVNSLSTADFENTATLARASLIVNYGGFATFIDSATAGNDPAHPSSLTIGTNAQTQFHNTASAGTANITFLSATAGGQGPSSYTRFFDMASAGSATVTNKGQQFGIGCFTEFHNSSSAASAIINNLGASAGNGALGGEADFFDGSNAGSATIVNNGATGGFGGHGGIVQFFNSATAGSASITNNWDLDSNNSGIGAYTNFNSGTSADHATITNNGGIYDNTNHPSQSGHTVFLGGSTADHATLIANGAQIALAAGGEVDVNFGATAGSATFTSNAGLVSGAAGGQVIVSGVSGTPALAGSATFIANGGTVSGALGGVVTLGNLSTANSATFTANGGNGAGTLGGTVNINDRADGATSTIIANGGTNGGTGGLIKFALSTSGGGTGGNARIVINAGGTFNNSNAATFSVGSIEGAGTFNIVGGILTSGSLNTNTTVSGSIIGLGNSGITKTGTGKLTLSGTDTYTGLTTVNGGALAINGSIVSAVTVNTGATLNGTGTITGSVSIAAGGTIAPGNSPGTLRVASLSLATNSTTSIELGGTARGTSTNNYDAIISTGSMTLGGTLQVSFVNDFNPIAGASFDILDWGSRSGTFSTLQLPTGGIVWDTSQLYTTGVVTVISSLQGDYNHNGTVDAADYIVWRKGLGTSYTQSDYNVWRTNFGQMAPGVGSGAVANVAVPEPTTLVLLMFAAAGRCHRRLRTT